MPLCLDLLSRFHVGLMVLVTSCLLLHVTRWIGKPVVSYDHMSPKSPPRDDHVRQLVYFSYMPRLGYTSGGLGGSISGYCRCLFLGSECSEVSATKDLRAVYYSASELWIRWVYR